MKKFVYPMLILLVTSLNIQAQPSFLDSSFGHQGQTLYPHTNSNDARVIETIEQADGKLITIYAHSNMIYLLRYDSEGRVDIDFGQNGIINTQIPTQSSLLPQLHRPGVSCVVQPDGKLIVAGGINHLVMKRYTSSGGVDMGYADNGISNTYFSIPGSPLFDHTKVQKLLPLPDGKMLAFATANYTPCGTVPTTNCGVYKTVIARYHADGSIDSSFNAVGYRFLDAQNIWNGNAVIEVTDAVVQTANEIVIAAGDLDGLINGSSSQYIARIDSNGAQDLSFNASVTPNYYPNSLLLQSNGLIVCAGVTTAGENYLTRILRTGDPDLTYGQNGYQNIYLDLGSGNINGQASVTMLHDMILLGASTGNLSSSASNQVVSVVAKIDDQGSVIENCHAVIHKGVTAGINSLLIQPDGKVVVGGVNSVGDIVLTRYYPYWGQLDQMSASACEPISYNGKTYWQSGIYVDTMQTSFGCDSAFALDLDINIHQRIEHIVACGSYTWTDGVTYTASNQVAQDTVLLSSGCMEIVSLDLVIGQPSTHVMNVNTCNPYIAPSGTTLWPTAGTYTDVIPNMYGCDSVITIHLTTDPLDDQVVQNGGSLIASQADVQYQWYNCDSQKPIPGANSQTYTPTDIGSYYVVVSSNGCVATSECIKVNVSGIGELNPFDIVLYPNPNKGEFKVDLGDNIGQITLLLYNSIGQEVYQATLLNQRLIEVQVSPEPGLYFLQLVTDEGRVTKQLVIE